MVRKLKFHEQKLLKKVDFINWEVDNNLHEVKVLRKYHIEKREDYTKYNKLSRNIRELAQKIRDLDEKDGFRAQSTALFLEKLYSVGLIPTKQNLSLTNEVCASAFCRRRLPTIMLKLRMAQNLKTAITFIEQGRILHHKSHDELCAHTLSVLYRCLYYIHIMLFNMHLLTLKSSEMWMSLFLQNRWRFFILCSEWVPSE
uniref:Small ribosomal subunit protein uS4 N-terminal domain-containing protein n=1 Tax=Cyprinus carpio TaxID=7962 RepID=A0A8C1V6L2_CYPCA